MSKEWEDAQRSSRRFEQCLLWLVWDFSGARFIWRKLWAEDERAIANSLNYKKPSTFTLWTIGVYMALYGLTSTKYELALDRAESRMSTVVAQLSTTNDEAFRNLISQIPEIQKIETPIKPHIFNLVSVVLSLFIEKVNPDIIGRSIKVVEVWKTKLNGVELVEANLTEAKLFRANLGEAYLGYANLTGAYLGYANLTGANLWGTNLTRANLEDANLTGADLGYANLTEAILWETNLTNTNIRDVEGVPKGFKTEALTKGAVDMGLYEWEVFVENGYKKGRFYNIKCGTDKSKPWVLKTDAVEMVWEEPATDVVKVNNTKDSNDKKDAEDSQVVPFTLKWLSQ